MEDKLVASTLETTNVNENNPKRQDGDTLTTDQPTTSDIQCEVGDDKTITTELSTEQNKDTTNSSAEIINEKLCDKVIAEEKIDTVEVAKNATESFDVDTNETHEDEPQIDINKIIDEQSNEENEIQKKVLEELSKLQRSHDIIEQDSDDTNKIGDDTIATEILSDDDAVNTDKQSNMEENNTKNLENDDEVTSQIDKKSENCEETEVNSPKQSVKENTEILDIKHPEKDVIEHNNDEDEVGSAELLPNQSLVVDVDENDSSSIEEESEKNENEVFEEKSDQNPDLEKDRKDSILNDKKIVDDTRKEEFNEETTTEPDTKNLDLIVDNKVNEMQDDEIITEDLTTNESLVSAIDEKDSNLNKETIFNDKTEDDVCEEKITENIATNQSLVVKENEKDSNRDDEVCEGEKTEDITTNLSLVVEANENDSNRDDDVCEEKKTEDVTTNQSLIVEANLNDSNGKTTADIKTNESLVVEDDEKDSSCNNKVNEEKLIENQSLIAETNEEKLNDEKQTDKDPVNEVKAVEKNSELITDKVVAGEIIKDSENNLEKSSTDSKIEDIDKPDKKTLKTTEFDDPKPSTSADALALAIKNAGIENEKQTVTTNNDDYDVLVISDSDDETTKPSTPPPSFPNSKRIIFSPKPVLHNDPVLDPLACNDDNEIMETDSVFVTPTEKLVVSVPEAIRIDAAQISESSEIDDDLVIVVEKINYAAKKVTELIDEVIQKSVVDDDLVIVSETIKDANKVADKVTEAEKIAEVIQKSDVEDESATLTKIPVSDSVEQTPTADQDAQKQKPSITEESSDKQDAATTSSETNAKDVEENKDTDEDVIMLDTDSTDEEKDESTKKSTTNLVPVVTPKASTSIESTSNSAEKSTDPFKRLEDLVTIAAAESVKRTLDSTINKETTKNKEKTNEKNDSTQKPEPAEQHPEIVKRKIPRDCVNFECKSKRTDDHVPAPIFVLSHFNVTKKINRIQYVCNQCFDIANEKYSIFKEAIINEQPLLLESLPKRAEFYEILDSSDEDDKDDISKVDKLAIAERDKPLPKELINTLLDNLVDVIGDIKDKYDLDKQAIWSDQINSHKLDSNDDLINEINNMCKDLQKRADVMHNRLYRNGNYVIEELPPLDLNTLKQMQLAGPTYPPTGELKYSKLDTFSLYYAVRSKLLAAWVPCKIIEEIPFVVGTLSQKTTYKVKFLRSKGIQMKSVLANHIAYGKPPPVRLQVGIRVIALFQIDLPNGQQPSQPATGQNQRASYFPGVIAEPLQSYNSWRYLIFFDDGYAQYVPHDNIRVICEASQKVWEDVHPDSATFIENYLLQYKTQRPMVQVRKGQRMITEWNGKWLYAKVNEIDASLVQMSFEDGRRIEWIYRGSTRLGPLFNEKQSQKTSVGLARRNVPYVEYMSINTDASAKNPSRQTNVVQTLQPSTSANAVTPSPSSSSKPAEQLRRFQQIQLQQQLQQQQQQEKEQNQKEQHQRSPAEEKRAVAKKSTSAPPPPPQPSSQIPANLRPTVQHMNNSTIYVDEDNRPKGKVVYYTAKKHMPPRKFQLHECNPSCLYDVKHNLSSYSPLAKPLLSGWERQICRSKNRRIVVYRSPCGRRLRNMGELHQYLRKTKCPMNVENFDFDFSIHCLAEYVIDACIYQEKDISDGKEAMAVPCVNYYDNTKPPTCIYSARRIPTDGVNLELDTDFLCGCDCDDDCLDKTKCQCWQLTIAGAKFGNPNSVPENIGYEFKRLPDPVPTGIYECNSRCKCAKTCMNRVAQHSIQLKLQVFKTGNRGWGLRCLNDVPKGSFICIYAGDLLTEQNANEAGDNYGDEYFAELDYIEVAENLKEGYEPDVLNDDDLDDEEYQPDLDPKHKGKDDDSDDDEFVTKAVVSGEPARKTRYNTRNSSIDTKPDEKASGSSKKSDKKKDSNNYGKDKIDPVTGEVMISDEDEERQQISFIPNASATSLEKDNATSKYKSIRKLYGKHEYVYIMDAKKRGNIGRYFNHSCAPNLFVQNVFVDTHDLRFPWVAFFALSHIRAGTELTWNYNYDVGSVPGKVLYCQCGSEACRGRLL